MQPKKATWHWWLILLAGAWLAAGQPGLDILPGIDSAPFVVEDARPHVLVVAKKNAKYSNDQFAVINGQVLSGLPAGTWATREPGQDVSKDAKWIAGAMEAAKAIPPPALTIANKSGGATVPLPANEAELQALITKYGG